MAASYGPRAHCEEWRSRGAGRLDPDRYQLDPVPHCQCCGESSYSIDGGVVTFPSGQMRCAKHIDRNPCAIEGCTRTHSSAHLSVNTWLCTEHWRLYCPPRSARRRAYRWFFREAKKRGYTANSRWDDDLERRYWAFWEQLIATARRKADGGSIDRHAIAKLFGWDEI